jgi:hypothetical protein
MANMIREQRVVDNNKRCLDKIVLVSDGTNESNTVLVNPATMRFALDANGVVMVDYTDPKPIYRTTIKRIMGVNSGTDTHVRLQWQGDSNSEIVTFGQGNFDYDFQSMGDGAVISNPEANATGNILISTAGFSANDTVTIFFDLRKDSRDYDAGQTADPVAFNRGPAAG